MRRALAAAAVIAAAAAGYGAGHLEDRAQPAQGCQLDLIDPDWGGLLQSGDSSMVRGLVYTCNDGTWTGPYGYLQPIAT